MSLLVPAALAFAIILPIILLLYFMRPKRQERIIGSTLLWQQALQDLQASRPWQRLRITPLLLLQLLAALIIVLVLARPAIFSSSPISGDAIIILQASASMQATDVVPNRFEEAKSQIMDLIDGMGSGDRLSLIEMANTPRVLLSLSQDKAKLTAALQGAEVTNQDADLEQALSLATSLAAGHSNIQVLVVGDGHVLTPDQTLNLPFPVRYLRIGTDASNVALLTLAARAVKGGSIALAQVANYSPQQRSIPIELYADGKLVGVQTIVLAAGAQGSVQWGALPASTRFLHARLVSQDPLTVDHDGWAIVGGSMHGSVLLVTKGNSFLEAALRLQTNITLFETTPAKYTGAGSYDLTVFDGFVPLTLPGGDLFFVNPPGGVYPFGKSGTEIAVNHISPGDNSDSFLHDVDLGSIHTLRSSHQLTPLPWMQSVIATDETPLLIAGEHDNRRIAVLGFDLHDSDLPLQPGFPILMYNLVNWFLPPPVAGDGQIPPGQPVTIQMWPGADQVVIAGPNQQQATVAPPFPVAPFADTDQTGIYQVTQRVHGQNRAGAFAVNVFDPLQSRLAPAAHLPVVSSTDFAPGSASVPHVLREIWPWIAAFLLLILCIEWWLFGRGYRVQATMPVKGATSLRSGSRVLPSRPPGTLATLRKQAEVRSKKLLKRVSRATRRPKHKAARSRSKGGRHANV